MAIDYSFGKRNVNFIPLSLHIQKSVLGGKMKSTILKLRKKIGEYLYLSSWGREKFLYAKVFT